MSKKKTKKQNKQTKKQTKNKKQKRKLLTLCVVVFDLLFFDADVDCVPTANWECQGQETLSLRQKVRVLPSK